jgi:hypothetical protein
MLDKNNIESINCITQIPVHNMGLSGDALFGKLHLTLRMSSTSKNTNAENTRTSRRDTLYNTVWSKKFLTATIYIEYEYYYDFIY